LFIYSQHAILHCRRIGIHSHDILDRRRRIGRIIILCTNIVIVIVIIIVSVIVVIVIAVAVTVTVTVTVSVIIPVIPTLETGFTCFC